MQNSKHSDCNDPSAVQIRSLITRLGDESEARRKPRLVISGNLAPLFIIFIFRKIPSS